MKKILFILLLSAGTVAQAQQKATIVNPIQGFWVIESNVKSPQIQVVKFYNSEQQLIYQEPYERKILNYSRKRIRKILDSALVTVLKNKDGKDELMNMANVINKK